MNGISVNYTAFNCKLPAGEGIDEFNISLRGNLVKRGINYVCWRDVLFADGVYCDKNEQFYLSYYEEVYIVSRADSTKPKSKS